MNVTVNLVPGAVFAVVAGCCEDYHARINQSARCPTDRIIPVRIDGGHTKTHVNDTNVVSSSIRGDPIERSQHPCGSTNAVSIQHAQADKVCIRRDTTYAPLE